MVATPEEIATDIERRNKEITVKINELMGQQEKVQARLSALQARRNSADRDKISELKAARTEASQTIGILARSRTELLDGLPIIATAAGELEVVAEELGKSARLIERSVERLKKVTSAIQSAEKTIVRIASLLKTVLI